MNFAKDMSCEHADILSLTARQRYGSFFLRRELSGQSVPQNENFFSSSPGRCSSSADVRSASSALPFPRELSRREFALLYYAMLCYALLCVLWDGFSLFFGRNVPILPFSVTFMPISATYSSAGMSCGTW